MKKIIKLNEIDLSHIVRRVISEQFEDMNEKNFSDYFPCFDHIASNEEELTSNCRANRSIGKKTLVNGYKLSINGIKNDCMRDLTEMLIEGEINMEDFSDFCNCLHTKKIDLYVE